MYRTQAIIDYGELEGKVLTLLSKLDVNIDPTISIKHQRQEGNSETF